MAKSTTALGTGIESLLAELDLGTSTPASTSPAKAPATTGAPRAAPATRPSRLSIAAGSGYAEQAISRNFHTLRTVLAAAQRLQARACLLTPRSPPPRARRARTMARRAPTEKLWRERDQIANDERLAQQLMNEDLRTVLAHMRLARPLQWLTARNSTAPLRASYLGTPEQRRSGTGAELRVDKPGRPPAAGKTPGTHADPNPPKAINTTSATVAVQVTAATPVRVPSSNRGRDPRVKKSAQLTRVEA